MTYKLYNHGLAASPRIYCRCIACNNMCSGHMVNMILTKVIRSYIFWVTHTVSS